MGTAPRAIHRIGHALPQPLLSYGLALLSVAGAWLVQQLLSTLIEIPNPFLLFLGAVIVSAWYGGARPGLLATALLALLGHSSLAPAVPPGGLAPGGLLQTALFVAEGLAICLFSASRSRAERALQARFHQQSDERLARVLQAIGEGVLIFDAGGRVTHANPAAERLLGRPAGWLRGRAHQELDAHIAAASGQPLPPEGQPLHQALRGGEPAAALYVIGQGDGSRVLRWVSAVPLCDPHGAPAGAVVSLREASAPTPADAERERLLAEVQTERSRLEAVLRQMPAGVIIVEAPSGQLLLSNRQLQRIIRRPLDDTSAIADGTAFLAAHADGQPYPPGQWPLLRAIRHGEEIADEELQIVRGDGSPATLLVSAAPIYDREGQIVAGVATLYDITGRTHADAAQRFLAEASALLVASLDFATTLQNLVRLTVPKLADFCTIHSVEGDELRLLSAAHADPAGEALLRTINERYPMRVDDYLSMPRVIAGDGPLIVSEGTEPHWRLQPRDQQHLALLRELRISSFMILPLTVCGVTFGALTLLRSAGSRPYSQGDLELAQELARRAAVALDNARLYHETQDAVRARDQFLSIASHELKTPLTSLMGYAELLQRRTAREGTLKERDARSLAVVVEQSARLNRLIGALLDLSRIQSGQLSIERQPVDLAALAGRLVESMQPSLEHHVFQLTGDDAPLLIEGDELRLEQVVQNLLQNAVKYSPSGGQIGVQLERRDGMARLAVSDQGIGIPKEALPRLFQRFYRANNVGPQQISGMGIGLFVVREIVSLHGGSVDVASQEGQGSTFMIDLPLMRG